MEKKFLVRIGLAHSDPKVVWEIKREVEAALADLGCWLVGFEIFDPAKGRTIPVQRTLEDVDIYLLILDGSAVTGMKDLERFQEECDGAQERTIPIVCLAHQNIQAFFSAAQDPEEHQKRKDFESLLKQETFAEWDSLVNLGNQLRICLPKVLNERMPVGWLRADTISSKTEILERRRLTKKFENVQSQLDLARRVSKRPTEWPYGENKYAAEFTFSANIDPTKNDKRDQLDAEAPLSGVAHLGSCKVAWKKLFIQIGPTMHNQNSELLLKNELSKLLRLVSFKKLQASPLFFDSEIKGFAIKESSFQVIIVQFKKWKLIELSEESNTKETYWRLTSHGQDILETLLAQL